MGKVTVAARIENVGDLLAADQGYLVCQGVRAIEVADALVDTRTTGLSMPRTLLETLGLKFLRTRKALSIAGPFEVHVFGMVRLTVQGRGSPAKSTCRRSALSANKIGLADLLDSRSASPC